MRSNGVAGVNSGRQAGGMQARQQLRHSEYLEASVAELADNFQAMLWTQQRRGERGRAPRKPAASGSVEDNLYDKLTCVRAVLFQHV